MKRRDKLFLLVITLGLLLFSISSFSKEKTTKIEIQKQFSIKWIDENRDLLIDVSDKIWKFAETALKEKESSSLLANVLEQNGFKVERGVAGMSTAFVATFGEGEPVIGIIAEYDALPGLSQKVSTKKEAISPGEPGHGCGHNLFGVACLGTALALKNTIENFKLKGTIKFFGCPAEETVVGKTYMAKEGIFDGLSVAISWHPGTENKVSTGSSQALNNFTVEFFGRTAHSAGDPWNGRSALDAVEFLNFGANLLREHVEPSVRIHYVIQEGGKAPNVVPDYAKVWYYVRDKDRKGVEDVYQRILNIVKGAALATDTTYKVQLITGVYNILPNITGARVMQKNLEKIGPPEFDEEDQRFAKEMQKELKKEEKGVSKKIEPFEENPPLRGGSTDVAEVSRITPTVQVNTACAPLDVPWHSWAVVASSGHLIGHKGMIIASKVMAATALDFMNDPEILKLMWKEFKERMQGKSYESPLPKEQKIPSQN